jgi:hypothetical protein
LYKTYSRKFTSSDIKPNQDIARNLKGLIFLDAFGLKLTLLEVGEILDLCHRTLTGFYLSLATDITEDNLYSQVRIYFRDIHFNLLHSVAQVLEDIVQNI